MNTEFFSLSLSRQEMRDLHEALVLRAMLEDELRREKGLEAVASRPLLERVESLLRPSDKRVETVTELADTSLWEYAWYTYTDEWAWFRARQDVEKETVGRSQALSADDLQAAIEQKYQRDFERYVQEVDMKEAPPSTKDEKRRKAA